MSNPSLATTLEPPPESTLTDDWHPKPFSPWWKILFVVVGALALAGVLALMSGCEDTNFNEAGLDGCTYALVRKNWSTLHVIRCPNSSTTVKYSCGKHCTANVTTIDGGAQ